MRSEIVGFLQPDNIMSTKKNNTALGAEGGTFTQNAVVTEIPIDMKWDEVKPGDSPYPVLPLRDQVMFPAVPMPVGIGRESSLELLREAYATNRPIITVCQKDPDVNDPGAKDLYRIGVICKVVRLMKLQEDGPTTAFLVAGSRVHLDRITAKKPYLRAKVSQLTDLQPKHGDLEFKVVMESVCEIYDNMAQFLPDQERNELQATIDQFKIDDEQAMSFRIINSPLDVAEKEMLLSIDDIKERARQLLRMFDGCYQKMELKANITMRTREELSRQQKEQFLQMQMRSIRDELGEGLSEDSDIDALRHRADEKNWNEEARAHFDRELQKLERYNIGNPEYALQYSYLDTLLNLPWNDYSTDDFSISQVEETLNRDHYGLEKVKERIVEHMAVLKLRKDMKAPILCLYGPPGVGKTSLGKSIADAMGRKYCRVSLGGLRDEAEIRGHRKTYLGSMPGRIITALAKCGKGNPVFVLDEIDKVGSDYKGDPSCALLEVLDPEQNNKFHDNYLECDYDLSQIMFIATANDLSGISRPLLDRMEIIEIPGYILEEKIEISKRHLIPKALKEHGLEEEISFTNEAIEYIISRYTRESGVRQLEKKLAKVLRRIARLKASEKEYPRKVDMELIREVLGKEEVTPDMYENNDYLGVVTGLAWTSVGGEILFIESSLANGKGDKLTLTGNLGDVMKESAVIALQYLKAHASEIGIDHELFNKKDVHVHVPEGAIPKDGPSAGITIATSLASSLTGRKVKPRLAMTGEITLRGKVLPVGGIKEKILAAKRAGITDIILSSQNRKDIDEIGSTYLSGLTFHYVENIEEVLNLALLEKVQP